MSFLEIGASLLGGLFSSDSASDAADAQAAGTAAATAEQRRQFDLTRQDYQPYRSIGTNALRRLGAIYGINEGGGGGMSQQQIEDMLRPQFTSGGGLTYDGVGSFESGQGWANGVRIPTGYSAGTVDTAGLNAAVQQRLQSQAPGEPQTYNDEFSQPIQMDPGYQFGMQQGQQALDRKTAAAGGRVSGAALKSAARFGTDYATTGYNAAYQRRQDSINRLASLAGIGQSATGASAQAGQNMANNVSQLAVNQGDNAGAASIAQGNIWGNALNQAGAAYQRQQTPGYWPSNMGQSWSYDK